MKMGIFGLQEINERSKLVLNVPFFCQFCILFAYHIFLIFIEYVCACHLVTTSLRFLQSSMY